MTTKQVAASVALLRALEQHSDDLAPDMRMSGGSWKDHILNQLSDYYLVAIPNGWGEIFNEGTDLPGSALILAFARDRYIYELKDLINLAGLSDGLDKPQARAVLLSAMHKHRTKAVTGEVVSELALIVGQGIHAIIRRLAQDAGRNYNFNEVVEVTSRRKYHPLLSQTLANSNFHMLDQYAPEFKKKLDRERIANDAGNYKLLADKLVNQRQRPEDTEAYRMGYLPESHLVQRAKRIVLREFLRDLWEVVRNPKRERKETA